MKKVYICGDSFAVPDSEYGPCWVDKLQDKFEIVNLARVCASNLQIATQVDKAISNNADFIILLMTSCTREDVQYKNRSKTDITERYVNVIDRDKTADLTSYSIFSLDNTTVLSDDQLTLINQYHTNFFDLDLAIYKNELILEGTLARLINSNIPFVYDQGGFENSNFVGTNDKKYFAQYAQYKSDINLWDLVTERQFRPYYHITDKAAHEKVAEYYLNLINGPKSSLNDNMDIKQLSANGYAITNVFGDLLDEIVDKCNTFKSGQIQPMGDGFREAHFLNERTDDLRQRIIKSLSPIILGVSPNANIRGVELWRDYPGYSNPYHVDDPVVQNIMIVYLGEEELDIGTGYIEDGDYKVQYKKNTAILLKNSCHIQHGMVGQVPDNIIRKTLYVNWLDG